MPEAYNNKYGINFLKHAQRCKQCSEAVKGIGPGLCARGRNLNDLYWKAFNDSRA